MNLRHDDEAMTVGDCKDMRDGCSKTRNVFRSVAMWAIGIALTILTGTIWYLVNTNGNQWQAIAGVREKVSAQEVTIANIDKKTDAMQQDIKELLRRH